MLNADDPDHAGAMPAAARRYSLWFSSTHDGGSAARSSMAARFVLDGQPLMRRREVPLRGLHNVENTMARRRSRASGRSHA